MTALKNRTAHQNIPIDQIDASASLSIDALRGQIRKRKKAPPKRGL